MKITNSLFAAFLVLFFTSCNNDDDSQEIFDQEYITYQINDEEPKTYVENLAALIYPVEPYYEYDLPILLVGANTAIELNDDCFYLRGPLNPESYTGIYSSVANFDQGPGFIISDCFGDYIMTSSGNDITFNLTSIGNVDEFIDINFSGTFTNFDNEESYISGTIHVLRDPID